MGISARNIAATHPLYWPTETSYTSYSDSYLLRPSAPARTPEALLVSPDAVVAPVIVGAQAASTSAVADVSVETHLHAGVDDNALVTEEASAVVGEQSGPLNYEVAPGDTVSTIAERFGISTETVLRANNLSNAHLIKIGQTLLILPAAVEDQSAATEKAPSAVAEQRGPVEYEVAPGDTVSTIAERFGISAETVLWANSLSNVNLLKIGQTLLILPTDGLVHTVVKGDTLLSIALRYGVDTESILGYPANDVRNADSLSIGQELVIPGGKMPSTRTAAASSSRGGTRAADTASPAPAQVAPPSGNFAWPVGGRITQYFNASHDAIDLAAPLGTPVVATDGGVVVDLQQLTWGLGWYVTINHGNGYTSTYSHLGSFGVSAGQRVSQGQVVGRIGMTGLTTGPHLHFIVRRNGVPVNPLGVLP